MKTRVLHVDADRAVLEDTMPTLETNDIAVTPVMSGEEALEMLDEADPEAVIVGTDVGDLDVIDFVGQIRNADPALPVLIYADSWDLGRTSTAVTAGVTDLVFREHEPNPPLALVSRIQAATDRERVASTGATGRGESAAAEERYRRLVESAPAPIVIYDDEGTIVYANQAAARFANADAPSELVGLDAIEFVAEDDREWIEERVQRVLEDRETAPQTEVEYRALDDERRFAVAVTAPVTYSGERAGQVVLHDVSELKQRERELEENRRRLETIIDNIPGMVYRCSTVESPWPMEYVGGRVDEMTGYTAGQLERQEVLWGRDVIHEEDVERAEQEVLDALARDEPFELTYRVVTADGEVKHLWEQGEAVREDGEVVALEGVIMDVTAQRERTRELEEQESYREELHRIANDEDLVPMERIESMLRLGRERFGVGIAFLATVDVDSGHHEVVVADSDHDAVHTGVVTPLERTYCRRVIRSDEIVGVNDAVEEGWEEDPAYIEHGLACYIGAKVYVDGELYGTVCFADEEPRADSFDHADEMFVEIVARAIGHELAMVEEPPE